MSESPELTPVGPNAPVKRRPGRPRKVNPEIEALQAQIRALKAALSETAERPVILATLPAASEELRPGSYFQVGVDASGTPLMGKIRWTREWIARTYPPVTFTPARSMRVAPHGISYDLGAEIEVTVPQIVKDIYDDVRKAEADHNIRYRTLSPGEDAELAVRANDQPGTKQWSRLYRAGYGLGVRLPEVETPPGAEPPPSP